MRKLFIFLLISIQTIAQEIPLPEHPRPDFYREKWQNLNGKWSFSFDNKDQGLSRDWKYGDVFADTIQVPFPWGSELSGVENKGDIAWYKKIIKLDSTWERNKTFIIIGASDYETTVWIDGNLLGTHKGGYTPFEFDLTKFLKYNTPQDIVVRVDDKKRDYALYGKQGYGDAKGIWQTVYLESRPYFYIKKLQFFPDIDNSLVKVRIETNTKAIQDETVGVKLNKMAFGEKTILLEGQNFIEFEVPIINQHLWSLEDPFLYDAEVSLGQDVLKSYFGMRKISVVNLPGTDYPYIALNNKPIYLESTLDQSYHPEGFYTFPSDEFVKNEVQLCKNIGLNSLRTHIKVDVPRKLYWADKLGLLIMSDLPNFWGEPTQQAKNESLYTLDAMIERDFNHPSIFSWVLFNETWGLKSGPDKKYLPETQKWVADMYKHAKNLDQTRLIEDNSICCGAGHTITDLNSWHEYLPGYAWEEHMQSIDENTFVGSKYHYEKGYFQEPNVPMINSECGNVWGYNGSTGDVDWSYDYHRMINTFRMHPKMAGWLYTEHHDVINEWNGYWRFDRTNKFTGLGDIASTMKINDFHSLIYLSNGNKITYTVNANSLNSIPIYISDMNGNLEKERIYIEYEISGITSYGKTVKTKGQRINFKYTPWMQQSLDSLQIQAPSENGLYQVIFRIKNKSNHVLHTNFVSLEVLGGKNQSGIIEIEIPIEKFSEAEWSGKQWTVFENKKINGTGKGHYTYNLEKLNIPKDAKYAYFLAELSAKQLFYKDLNLKEDKNIDYMLGGKIESSQNPNSYPMTDEAKFSSSVIFSINNKILKEVYLEDDPADHRGILSWHHQKEDKTLNEAGSYGYLVKIPIPVASLRSQKSLELKIESKGEGGLAIYNKDFGRYPFGLKLIIE